MRPLSPTERNIVSADKCVIEMVRNVVQLAGFEFVAHCWLEGVRTSKPEKLSVSTCTVPEMDIGINNRSRLYVP